MTSARPTLVFETLEDLRLIVVYHSPERPSDAEWDAWLAAADELWQKVPEFRLLVVSEGGHPNKNQLARLETVKRRQERARGKTSCEPVTAILSASVAMRFVVSGVTLFNRKVRCFAPGALVSAYEHLGLARPEGQRARAAVERLRARIAESATAA